MNLTPTLIVLLQELERFNRLLSRMQTSLTLLRKALAGEIGMDLNLDNIATSIFNGQIPDDWRKLAPDTCKSLSSWMEHLNRRAVQYRYWSSSGEPLVMWLSGLHVPESFLTALVQIACRKNNWPLDRSTLFTAVTEFADIDDVEERVETVCICFSFLLNFVTIQKSPIGLLCEWIIPRRCPLESKETLSREIIAESSCRGPANSVDSANRKSST